MNGELDAHVAKLDDEGTHLIYSTYIGGEASFDNANYIASRFHRCGLCHGHHDERGFSDNTRGISANTPGRFRACI